MNKTILILNKYTNSLKLLKGQREILYCDERNNLPNNPIFRKWAKLMNKQFTEKY